jgi:serine/threonine protein kinase
MAPEQASGESIDYRADLFSLGSVLYAMSTGHSPFRAETTVAVLRRICDGAHRPVREVNADIPEWLAAIIDKLLAKRPTDRFGSAEEVARLLAEHLAHLQHPMRRRWSPSRRLIQWATGLATVLAVLVLVAFFANKLRNDGEPNSSARASTSPADPAGKNTHAVPGRAQQTRGDLSAESDNVFQAELGRIHQELWRLESLLFSRDAVYPPTNDPLRQIEARLQVLETEFRGPEPISQPSTAEVQKR